MKSYFMMVGEKMMSTAALIPTLQSDYMSDTLFLFTCVLALFFLLFLLYVLVYF